MADTLQMSQAALLAFETGFIAKMQQTQSRLNELATVVPLQGKEQYYDGVGTIEAQEISGAHADIPEQEIEQFRRKWQWKSYVIAIRVDGDMLKKITQDPSSAFLEQCVYACNRERDRIIYAAMFATVYTGVEGTTATSAASDGVLTVDGTSGATYETLLSLSQNFINNEVNNDGDMEAYIGITGTEHTAFMKEQEFTSRDYTNTLVIENGKIASGAGFKFIRFAGSDAAITVPRPMLTEASLVRRSFCAAKGAIRLGIVLDKTVGIYDQDAVKAAVNSKLLKVNFIMGATREEGKKIQQFNLTVAS
jgi:hypothetical protein